MHDDSHFMMLQTMLKGILNIHRKENDNIHKRRKKKATEIYVIKRKTSQEK